MRRLHSLEQQLHRQLDLAGTAEITRREARTARDQAEGGRPEDRDRLREINLIEQIEKICSHLPLDPFGNSGVFDNCKIEVRESRPDDRVPAEVAKRVAWVEEHRRILNIGYRACGAVGGGAKSGFDRTGYARPQKRAARERRVTRMEVDRIAALRLLNQRNLPPLLEAVAFER